MPPIDCIFLLDNYSNDVQQNIALNGLEKHLRRTY